MNVPPGVPFDLADQGEPGLTSPPSNIEELELLALEKRPELREEDYKARVGLYESRKQLLSLFPNLNLMVGRGTTPTSTSTTATGSVHGAPFWNLLRLAAASDIERTNETRQQTTRPVASRFRWRSSRRCASPSTATPWHSPTTGSPTRRRGSISASRRSAAPASPAA